MQETTNGFPFSLSPSRGFAIILYFFLGLLCFELVSGETLGVPAKKKEQPGRYWTVLIAQAAAGIVFVALLYFLAR